MKKKIKLFIFSLLIIGLLSGCTFEEPGYVSVIGNPEVKVVDSDGDIIAIDEVTGNLEMQVVDSDGNIITIDEVTGALTTISFAHHEVHEGNSFIFISTDIAMADNAVITIVFKTMPAPKRVHMFVEFTTLVGGDLQVWEGVTWNTNTGGLYSIVNRKRETSMTSSGLLEDKTATPAFTATNNVLVKPAGFDTTGAVSLLRFYAWGRKEKILAGNVRDTEELILKPDTRYGIVFTAEGDANKAQVILNFYEHIHED